jgi:hypothetical protein
MEFLYYPLRSGKGSLYKGGVRTSLITNYPGVSQKGVICNTLVIFPMISIRHFEIKQSVSQNMILHIVILTE